jgi:tRNA(fMet)-specific endonuclease VapC
MLDSSVLIAAERAEFRLEEFLTAAGSEPVAISAVTASELLHGYHRATASGVRARRAAFVEGTLDLFTVLPFGLAEARRHAELWATLVATGATIGPHDLIIAATALTHGMSLATLNQDGFSRVSGLKLAATHRWQRQ